MVEAVRRRPKTVPASQGVTSEATSSSTFRTNNNNNRKKRRKRPDRFVAWYYWVFLLLLWPVVLKLLWSFFSASETTTTPDTRTLKASLASLLHRPEVTGYGPSRPRVAVVVSGEDVDDVARSVRSVFGHTDRNRLLLVVAVLDGVALDPAIVQEFNNVDRGATPHWHGLTYHSQRLGGQSRTEEHEGHKIRVVFHAAPLGVNACRRVGAALVQELSDKYEQAGLKDKEEEILLLLLQANATLDSSDWLDPVTAALIVPEDAADTARLTNAVSFLPHQHDYQDRNPAFDRAFHPVTTATTDVEDDSRPTPVAHGACTALRLHTFLDLPAHDEALTTRYAADLELSFNLWLCGDGVDVLFRAGVLVDGDHDHARLDHATAARLGAAWLDEARLQELYQAREADTTTPVVSLQRLARYAEEARATSSFPTDLHDKCRPWQWYVENVYDAATHEDAAPPPPVQNAGKSNVIKARVVVNKQALAAATAKSNVMKAKVMHHDRPLHDDFVPPKQEPVKTGHVKPQASPHKYRLSPAKLEILSHAKLMELAFERVGTTAEHPHMGGTDADGNPGYVHDATALLRERPKFHDGALEQHCAARDGNWKMLTERVQVVKKEETTDKEEKHGKPVKLFCTVYSIEKEHDKKIKPIRETWGQKCDGFMVASTKTDPSLNTVNIPHEGVEEYNNIWQKIRSTWSYVYDHYYEDYDWFHIGGDDLFLIVENLRYYLESEEIQLAAGGGRSGEPNKNKPLFLGRRFAEQGNMNRIFNSGGSGYTINKAALKLLVTIGLPKQFPHLKTFAEDVMVAAAFRNQGVYPYETKDEEGGERYMPFQPAHHLTYRLPQNKKGDWYANYSINIKTGLAHCAKHAVAYHYIDPNMMKRMYAILYGYCD